MDYFTIDPPPNCPLNGVCFFFIQCFFLSIFQKCQLTEDWSKTFWFIRKWRFYPIKYGRNLGVPGGRGGGGRVTLFFDRYTPQLLFFNLLNIMRWTGFELVFSDLKKKTVLHHLHGLGSYRHWGLTADFGLFRLNANKSKSNDQIFIKLTILKNIDQTTSIWHIANILRPHTRTSRQP